MSVATQARRPGLLDVVCWVLVVPAAWLWATQAYLLGITLVQIGDETEHSPLLLAALGLPLTLLATAALVAVLRARKGRRIGAGPLSACALAGCLVAADLLALGGAVSQEFVALLPSIITFLL